MMRAPELGFEGLKAALAYARRDLCFAQSNLWRARKWGYQRFELDHFERLVCSHLDHVYDVQEKLKPLEAIEAWGRRQQP